MANSFVDKRLKRILQRKTKICPTCKKRKPYNSDYFPFKNKNAGLLHKQLYPICKECKRKAGREYFNNPEVRERMRLRGIENRLRLKLDVFNAYGGCKCSCPNCTINHIDFLTLDHIGGGGNEHRRTLGGNSKVYWWIKRNNFPPGFRVRCYNCNLSAKFNGYCPVHESENTVIDEEIKFKCIQ